MVQISDFYGNWIIENRSTIYYESTFIIIDENKFNIFLGPINYVRKNNFYDTKNIFFVSPILKKFQIYFLWLSGFR